MMLVGKGKECTCQLEINSGRAKIIWNRVTTINQPQAGPTSESFAVDQKKRFWAKSTTTENG